MNNLKKIEVNKFFNSKKRIRNLGEVYTDRKEINAMLNLIPENIYEKIDAKFLEPACGNGNFLEEIIKKKLYLIKKPKDVISNQLHIEYQILTIMTSIYGIDKDKKNIVLAKNRIKKLITNFFSKKFSKLIPSKKFLKILNEIIEQNIIQGDFINKQHKVILTDWLRPIDGKFVTRKYCLEDLTSPLCMPLKGSKQIIYY